jgi:hypothetical protein
VNKIYSIPSHPTLCLPSSSSVVMTFKLSSIASLLLAGAIAASVKKPNILFILTDDQDWHMQSMVSPRSSASSSSISRTNFLSATYAISPEIPHQ